ncbi:MAG: dihydropteroate synthase [Endomicrobium sp.]|uniref:dihydropteroate synthase n=1 Tax=Candidatus Endomicrobiellum cubanum TaxID=3242325 RepID=UPI00281ADE55|nr:dihydropteroate synthase [Endomicrobium sp.]
MIVRKAIINNLKDALELTKKTGSSSIVHEYLAQKGINFPVIIEQIDNRAANILKQEAISVGADVSVSQDVSRFKKGFSDIVLFANLTQILKLFDKLKMQPFGLKEVALNFKQLINNKKVFKCRDKSLDFSCPIVMGIVNMDPDSFSGDGLTCPDKAQGQALEFEECGAGIIDIGAESSRPGSNFVDAKTEIKRLIPALKKIKKKLKIPISIDTYKYETAKAALDEGADIINDIFALRVGKEKLAKLIANVKAGLILMHMKGLPKNMQKSPKYKDCTCEVFKFLLDRKNYALNFGVQEECISVDPGAGFGKTVEHNLELIKNIRTFSSLGAVVGAVSRKRFVKALSGEDKTSFVVANFLTAFCGADILRVHDVKETVNVLKMIQAFKGV